MSDLSKQHARWIKGFTKDDFDILVKSYIRSVWKMDEVIFIDGKGDGGLDIKIFENRRTRKIPLQVTVEDQPYYKLQKDFVKIDKAINEYGYQAELHFFCSDSISQSKVEELEQEAWENYEIELSIIDSKVIGSLAESPKHPLLRQTIRELLGDFLQPNYKSRFDAIDQLKYDLLTFSRETSQIKEKIVESFIVNKLYHETSISTGVLEDCVNTDLNLGDDPTNCKRFFQKLERDGRVEIKSNAYQLTNKEKDEIDLLKENLNFQEEYFLLEIEEVIEKYQLKGNKDEILKKIYDLYSKSYDKDFNEIEENYDDEVFLANIFQQLKEYFLSISVKKEQIDSILLDFIEIFKNNSIVQRIAAGKLFSSLFESRELQAYVNRGPKPVFLDTSICLYLLCLYYNPTSTYDNPYFKIVKDLYEYHIKGNFKFELKVYDSYLEEISYQFENATSLVLFEKFGLISKLGGSNNLFYQFYSYLKENHELNQGDDDYGSFINSFNLLGEQNFGAQDSRSIIISGLKNLFNTNDVEVVSANINYQTHRKHKEFYANVKKELDSIHAYNKNERPSITVSRDARMVCLLFDDQLHQIEPTFITWDKSFRAIRKYVLSRDKGKTYWHLFRPSKFLDHLSLLNFQLNPELLSNELLTILDRDSDLNSSVKTLADSLSKIIDLKSQNGISFTNGIGDIKSKNVYNIESTEQDDHFHTTKFEPVDVVIDEVIKFFYSSSKYTIDHLSFLINKSDNSKKFLDLIEQAVEKYKTTHRVNKELYKSIEKLIE